MQHNESVGVPGYASPVWDMLCLWDASRVDYHKWRREVDSRGNEWGYCEVCGKVPDESMDARLVYREAKEAV